MRLAHRLTFSFIISAVTASFASGPASTSFASDKLGNVYCFAEYSDGVPFFSFGAQCTQGKVYKKEIRKLMPTGEEFIDLQNEVISKMKRDGYQVLESFRVGQILVLKKSSRARMEAQKDMCVISSVKTGIFSKDKYPYSVVFPGAVLDCSKDADVKLQDADRMSASEVLEQNGFKKVAQIGVVGIYER
jgi:hypothetical protein